VAAVIEATERIQERIAGAALDKEAEGYRVVEGGQTDRIWTVSLRGS
jgi:hypothetical protein